MEKLLKIMQANNLEELANKVRLKKANKDELKVLADFAYQAENHIEGRLIQLESIAKAVQVACIDSDDTGIYNHKVDGFNFAYWLQEEVQALQAFTAMSSDYDYLSREKTS